MAESIRRIAVGCDHAGFQYKEKIKEFLVSKGIDVKDFGTNSEEPVDYPVFFRLLAEAVAKGEFPVGIVLGGSGNGEAIVANKVKGIRCALCWNVESACLAKEHNNANMISIGQRMISLEIALKIVDAWLDADFQAGRHERKIKQIEAL